ncbi:hypothetical protein [Amycolatopsis sp. lyj-23]|uniref:hypothetical protein n=1 Tax=Amycolatopsis sp. lyj-23 TaxID=2789283 RepID=UPI0039799004
MAARQAVTSTRTSTARLAAHLLLVLCTGAAAYSIAAVALLVLDGRCLTQPATTGCAPLRLHLAQFLPAYATALALLHGAVAGAVQLCRRRAINPVITADWLLLITATLAALALRF